jgi:hypothetical protein
MGHVVQSCCTVVMVHKTRLDGIIMLSMTSL